MFVAVASRTALSVSIHKAGCAHLNTRTDYDIVGRSEDITDLKRVALQVYDEDTVPLVKFRNSGCMR